jgi:hypothetical protein
MTKQVLGKPRGKVDDKVFKKINSKTFVGSAPGPYKKTKSEKLISNRKKFGNCIIFSKVVIKSPLVKFLWKKSKQPGKSVLNKIFKYNHPRVSAKGISSSCSILPNNTYIHEVSVHLDLNSLSFKFITNGQSFDNFIPPLTIIALVYLTDPVNAKSKNKEVYIMVDELIDSYTFSANDFNEFNFELEKGSFSILEDYKTAIVFPALISSTESSNEIVWTQCEGIYVKGSPSVVKKSITEPFNPKPKKSFRIEYV